MKKTLLAIFIIVSITFQVISAQEQPYSPGEKISYQIRYGLVGSGEGLLEIKEDLYKGEPVWHAVATGQTVGIADALYHVRDTYESYINPETDLPVFSIRNIHEGRYRMYNEVAFDHTSSIDSTLVFSDRSGKHTAPKGLLDVVSCFYWFRKYHLANADTLIPGQTFTMTTWFADELYPIVLRYKGMETVKVREGRILCYRFHPVTEVGRVFETNEDMVMWFSADENFIPVKVRFDIFVGAFHVEMIKSEGLKTPLKFIK